MRRYSLWAPRHVWRVMPGDASGAQAHFAAVVGRTTRHQATRYVCRVPEPSA